LNQTEITYQYASQAQIEFQKSTQLFQGNNWAPRPAVMVAGQVEHQRVPQKPCCGSTFPAHHLL
jgi:hypothetical protein